MRSLSLFLTATLLMVAAAAATTSPLDRKLITLTTPVTVNVVNGFMAGSGIQLAIHCKSGDDDLGNKMVDPGAGVSFTFRPNIFGTTLYLCTVSHDKPYRVVRFDAYKYGRDSERCFSRCNWFVKELGVYGIDQSTGAQDFSFAWE